MLFRSLSFNSTKSLKLMWKPSAKNAKSELTVGIVHLPSPNPNLSSTESRSVLGLRMSKMTKIGDRVRCPECGRESQVVWVSQDGKLAAIKCARHHSQISPSPAKFSSHAQPKTKRGMVFLVEVS